MATGVELPVSRRFQRLPWALPLRRMSPSGKFVMSAVVPDGAGIDVRGPWLRVEGGRRYGLPRRIAAFGRILGAYEFWPPGSVVGVPYHLPRRPLTVRIARVGPVVDNVVVGVEGWDAIRSIFAPSLRRRPVQRWTFAVPPDLDVVKFGVVHGGDPGAPPVKVRVTVEDACLARRYRLVGPHGAGLHHYRNPDALPRAYAARRLLPARDLQEARYLVGDAPAFRPGRTAVVPAAARLPRRLGPGRVLRARFGQDHALIDVAAGRRGTFLVVNDRFDPHWAATVDGRPVPLHRTNGIVRGLVVPPGRHRVRLAFAVPTALYLGAGAALVGVAVALLLLPALQRRLWDL